jgi:hypothetical protein
MELRFLLLADAANLSREGKLNIAGEFNAIWAAQLPVVWPQLVIVARLEANAGEGADHAAQIKITDEDGKPIIQSVPMPIKFASSGKGMPIRADLQFGLAGLTLPQFGAYTVHLVVDGVQRGETELYCNKLVPPALPPGS